MKTSNDEFQQVANAINQIREILQSLEFDMATALQRGLSEAERSFVRKAARQLKKRARAQGGRPENFFDSGKDLHELIEKKLGWLSVIANATEIKKIIEESSKEAK